MIQQIIEPTGTMADLLFSLQKLQLEDEQLYQYFGVRSIIQNEIYVVHYCTPLEKNILITYLLNLYNSNEDIPQQDVLFIDNQHNFNIPDSIFVASCYSKEDLVVQLNAARFILKTNRKIRLVIIDSINWKMKEVKRKTSRTINEKILQFDKEVELVIEEIITSLKEFNAIIIVFNLMYYAQNQIKITHNHQFQCSKKLLEQIQENTSFIFPPLFFDQELYTQIYNKNQKNILFTQISVFENKSKIKYCIFDNKNMIETGEILEPF